MQRPKARGADGTEGPPDSGALMAGAPTLWAYLTEDRWEDGGKRERATLLILTEGTTVKLWLNDRATARNAWVAGKTLEEAVESLESQLSEERVAWRTVEPNKAKK